MDLRISRGTLETEKLTPLSARQLSVEGSAALPGSLREEARVLHAQALIMAEECEVSAGRATANGRVIFRVLYTQGDPATPRYIEASADFTERVQADREAEGRLLPRARVAQVSAKAGGGRLSLRAVVELAPMLVVSRAAEVIEDIEGDVEKLSRGVSLLRTVSRGGGQALVREEIELPEALKITETLFASADARAGEIMGGEGGRASVAGALEITAYHLSSLPGKPLCVTRHTVPFEQTVDVPVSGGERLCARALVRDTAALSQEGGDGRIMRLEALVDISVEALKTEEKTLLRDAFTRGGECLSLSRAVIEYRAAGGDIEATETARPVLTLPPGAPPIRQPLCGFVSPELLQARRAGARLTVEGNALLTLLYMTDGQDAPVAVSREEPFRASFALDASPDDLLSLSASQVEPVLLAGDRAEMRHALRLRAGLVSPGEIEAVTAAELAPAPEPPPGVTLLTAAPGDTLWSVAKQFRLSPADAARFTDGLDPTHPDALIREGEKVVIYRK